MPPAHDDAFPAAPLEGEPLVLDLDRLAVLGVDERVAVPADHLGGVVAEDPLHRGVAVREHEGRVHRPDPFRRRLHDRAELLLAFEQRFLGFAARAAVGPLLEGAADGGHQPGQVLLDDEVGGARLQRLNGALFPEGAGNEEERGVRRPLQRLGQGGEAVVRREVVVGQDDVHGITERGDEGRLVLCPLDRDVELVGAKRFLDERRVEGVVLQVQDADGHQASADGGSAGEMCAMKGRIIRLLCPNCP